MVTNEEIWKEINADWSIISTDDCGAECEDDIDECDDIHHCFKHTLEWQDDVASRFQAATAKRIFEKLNNCSVDANRLTFDEVLDILDRQSSEIIWYWLLDADKVDSLKKEFGVD